MTGCFTSLREGTNCVIYEGWGLRVMKQGYLTYDVMPGRKNLTQERLIIIIIYYICKALFIILV